MFPARITLDADHEPFALAVDAPMADVMDADTTDDPCISAVDVPAARPALAEDAALAPADVVAEPFAACGDASARADPIAPVEALPMAIDAVAEETDADDPVRVDVVDDPAATLADAADTTEPDALAVDVPADADAVVALCALPDAAVVAEPLAVDA